LIEHYKKTHYAHNLRFIIAGSMRGRRFEIKKLIEGVGLNKGASRIKLPLEKAKKPEKTTFMANQTVPNIYLIISSHFNDIIGTRDDDALGLARVMLTETLYSKIFGQARDRGLVYHVSSGHHLSNKLTEWYLSAQVLAENAPALCEIVLTEVKKIQNGIINEAELEAAKQYALGSFQRSMQTVQNIAGAYNRYFFDGYIEDMPSIPGRIKAVSKSDMAKAMQQMFAEDLGSVGVLGGTDSSLPSKLYDQLHPLWR